MKLYLLFTFVFLFTACSNNPTFSTQKENHIKNKINHNKIIAAKAKKAYLKLQKQRNLD